jgi:hypothetical protein
LGHSTILKTFKTNVPEMISWRNWERLKNPYSMLIEKEPVEYLSKNGAYAPKTNSILAADGNVQKSPSSKATVLLTRGAYTLYVSTAKGRERRWRLFSTFPKR